ncbi:MAG TPA: hypothetical protein VHG72_06800, partial [Polyangia bacterium]|nr:hypothetical protein [Polyangia bacterium]
MDGSHPEPVDAAPVDAAVSTPDAGWPPAIDGTPYTGSTTSITVGVSKQITGGRLVAGFAGFSFEKSHMTDGFFTGSNAPLIALFRLLGPGFVRIGANDVGREQWQATALPVAGGTTSKNVGTADLDDLAAFLKATNWQVMYGLNLNPTAGVSNSVAEATYAANVLGSNLYTFEMGNEPSDYATFKPAWEAMQSAIKTAVPTAQFNGPESNTTSTTTQFAADEAGRIVLLTHHHYVGGAGTSNATIAYLLKGDTGTISETRTFVQAATGAKLRDGFRWGEDNSFYGHGQPGVSDAFASALWGIEHMFKAAETGAVGVNFHGGGQNMDGNSCPTGPSSCTKPFVYSPIDEVNSQVTAAAPLYYAMLFISRAGVGNTLSTTVSSGNLNVFAHAVSLDSGGTNVVIVNNEASAGLSARVSFGTAVS